jgi:hypothetical protein
MIFRIIEHYDDYEENNVNNNFGDPVECFICYEIKNENEYNPLKLNKQNYYSKHCECDGFIHKKCLDKWYKQKKTCPICRNYIYENITLDVSIIKNHQFGYLVFYFILLKKITKSLFSYFSYLFFFVFLFKMYISVINKLHNRISDDYDNEVFILEHDNH